MYSLLEIAYIIYGVWDIVLGVLDDVFGIWDGIWHLEQTVPNSVFGIWVGMVHLVTFVFPMKHVMILTLDYGLCNFFSNRHLNLQRYRAARINVRVKKIVKKEETILGGI